MKEPITISLREYTILKKQMDDLRRVSNSWQKKYQKLKDKYEPDVPESETICEHKLHKATEALKDIRGQLRFSHKGESTVAYITHLLKELE